MKPSVTDSKRNGNAHIHVVNENNAGYNFLINLASVIDNYGIDCLIIKKRNRGIGKRIQTK